MTPNDGTDYLKEKKTILLDTLKSMIGNWDMAEGLHGLITEDKLSETTLDMIIELIRTAVINVKDTESRNRLESSLQKLADLKMMELKERQEDAQSAGDMINNF